MMIGHHSQAGSGGLETLREVAATAGVSLATATVRFRDVFLWRRALLHWTRTSAGWCFDDEAGVMPWEQGLIAPWADVSPILSAAAVQPGVVLDQDMPLRLGVVEENVRVQLLAGREAAFALVPLPRDLGRRAA
jgi:hypothetical protein